MIHKLYHNHTFRCKHAIGEVEDYCKAAIKNEINVIGISDHTPLPDNRWLFERMHFSELKEHVLEINSSIKKYQFKDLIILKSMECDFIKEYTSFYKEEYLDHYGFDYLIGAVHWFLQDGNWIRIPGKLKDHNSLYAYTEQYIEAMNSGIFLFMAHPDIFGIFYPVWDKHAEICSIKILESARDLKIPLEINSHGFRKSYIKTPNGLIRKYPISRFWDLSSEFEIEVVLSADAHNPKDIIRDLDKCLDFVTTNQLKIADFSFLEK